MKEKKDFQTILALYSILEIRLVSLETVLSNFFFFFFLKSLTYLWYLFLMMLSYSDYKDTFRSSKWKALSVLFLQKFIILYFLTLLCHPSYRSHLLMQIEITFFWSSYRSFTSSKEKKIIQTAFITGEGVDNLSAEFSRFWRTPTVLQNKKFRNFLPFTYFYLLSVDMNVYFISTYNVIRVFTPDLDLFPKVFTIDKGSGVYLNLTLKDFRLDSD